MEFQKGRVHGEKSELSQNYGGGAWCGAISSICQKQKWKQKFNSSGSQAVLTNIMEDRTTLNPSTIDVMVDSPSKKQKTARYWLPSSGN